MINERNVTYATEDFFTRNIFNAVKRVFMLFAVGRHKEVYEGLQDIKKFIEFYRDKVCDWGYCETYVPCRTTNAAMDKKALEEIINIAQMVLLTPNEGKEQILSQHLWRLIDGWNTGCLIELFLCRAEVEFLVSSKTIRVTDEELAKMERIVNDRKK